jgi:hypothetical protein
MAKAIIEFCGSTEWWSQLFDTNGLSQEDIEWCEEEYWQEFFWAIQEEPRLKGVKFVVARKCRLTYHGWNGAQWVWTCGLLGAWWTPGMHAMGAIERCEQAAHETAVRCIDSCRQRLEDDRKQAEEDELVRQAMREQGDNQ